MKTAISKQELVETKWNPNLGIKEGKYYTL
jgi:hypothetical protein